MAEDIGIDNNCQISGHYENTSNYQDNKTDKQD